MTDEELPLEGGNSTDGVVRVGMTVRKPWTASTPAVTAFMAAVAAGGVDVPAVRGRDERGRQVIDYIPGDLASASAPLSPSGLGRAGRLVRAIHDASEGFVPAAGSVWHTAVPAPGSDLVCHNDLAPWNFIIGERWVFIDWDGAGPSTRLWDLAYAAQAFTLSDVHEDPRTAASRLAAFVDGYGADESLRERLPETMPRRAAAMHDLLRESHRSGREPWASMYPAGHGRHWRDATLYAERHVRIWASVLSPASEPS